MDFPVGTINQNQNQRKGQQIKSETYRIKDRTSQINGCNDARHYTSIKEVLDRLNRLEIDHEQLKRQFRGYVRNNPSRQQFDTLRQDLREFKIKNVKAEEKGCIRFQNENLDKETEPLYSNLQCRLIKTQSQKIEGLESLVKAGFSNIQNLLVQLKKDEEKKEKAKKPVFFNVGSSLTKNSLQSITIGPSKAIQKISSSGQRKVGNDKRQDNPFLTKNFSKTQEIDSKHSPKISQLFFHKQKYQDFDVTYEEIPKLFQKSHYKNLNIENKNGKVEIENISPDLIDFQNLESSISLKPNFCLVLDNRWENLKVKVTTYNFMDFRSLTAEQKKQVIETVKIQSIQNKLSYLFDEKTGDLQLTSNCDL